MLRIHVVSGAPYLDASHDLGHGERWNATGEMYATLVVEVVNVCGAARSVDSVELWEAIAHRVTSTANRAWQTQGHDRTSEWSAAVGRGRRYVRVVTGYPGSIMAV